MNKAELGQVFTSKLIADYMVSLFSLKHSDCILDPCFGGAVFIDALMDANYTNIVGCELDPEWYTNAVSRLEGPTLVHGDFLKFTPSSPIDGIIMNPPYIRQEKIDELERFGISKAKLSANPIFSMLPRTANLYMYFIIHGLHLLRTGGEMVVIFPGSWLDARSGVAFRKYLFSECDVTHQIHVSGEVFTGSALVDVVILKIIKRPPSTKALLLHGQVQNNALNIITPQCNELNLSFPVPMSQYATVRRGLTTGCNSVFINPPISLDTANHLLPIISSPKDFDGYTTDSAQCDQLLVVSDFIKCSTSVKEYLQDEENKIRTTQKPKTIYEKIIRGEPWYKFSTFDCKGIIFSYFVRNEMKFVLNNSCSIVRDNFYVITPSIDNYLMFALLNNYFTYYQLECKGKKYGGGLLKLQRYDLDALTFPDTSAFSAQVTTNLIALSQRLVSTGDSKLIDSITEILASQVGISASVIKEKYQNIKQCRLENA